MVHSDHHSSSTVLTAALRRLFPPNVLLSMTVKHLQFGVVCSEAALLPCSVKEKNMAFSCSPPNNPHLMDKYGCHEI